MPGESVLFMHWCIKCNCFKYEYKNHIKCSWCTKCEKETGNHLYKGQNFKTIQAYYRYKKLNQIL